MTEEQITLVKNSWKVFRKMDPGFVGDVFYSKLFFENPKLRQMFPHSMDHQYQKLIEMLSVIISKLDRLNDITADIKAMALRHEGYGVKPQHYRLLGNALLWTMERGLGNDWNDKVKEAWSACYTKIAETMIAAVQDINTTQHP
jgi:nitric oxide dioxygenase